MMPSESYASLNYANINAAPWATSVKHSRDGLSINFDPSATVDSGRVGDEACVIERHGCMDSAAVNYDKYATVPTTCYQVIYGCLHPDALNTYCITDGPSKCTWSDTLVTVPDTVNSNLGRCRFYAPAPSPPPTKCGGGDTCEFNNVIRTTFAKDVSEWTQAEIDDICIALEALITGTKPDSCITVITGGSSLATTTQTFPDDDSAQAAQTQVSAVLTSAQAASSFFGQSVLDVEVTSIIIVVKRAADDDLPLILGAVFGALGGLCLIAGVVFFMKRKGGKVEA